METIFCPGCASGTHHGGAACPVCGAPCAVEMSSFVPRNPFKLIALCVSWAVAFWLGSLLLLGEQAERQLGGTLLLASIGLSIALTVRGVLPGTQKSLRA
jgi:hypothetical protein